MDVLDTKTSQLNSVREKELKAFDDTKLGVKGLVDAGILKIPGIFVRPTHELSEELTYSRNQLQVPVIDFQGIENLECRKQIIAQVKQASEQWGFFQVVNHGIPLSVLEGMIDGNHAGSQQWSWLQHVYELGDTITDLLSEALGLKADHLKTMECSRGHYYSACPEPELATGISKHSDTSFFTRLLQEQVGGLQVLHGDKWTDVEPIAGGLVVNIGDLLQGSPVESIDYAPIEELVSEENPPIYRSFQDNVTAKFRN